MSNHDVLSLIKQADKAISAEDFEALMEFYADDAVLVVQPGQIAQGKPQIRKAFEAIAKHFKNALTVTQGEAQVIEGGDTALVIMETHLHIGDEPNRLPVVQLMFSEKTRLAAGFAQLTTLMEPNCSTPPSDMSSSSRCA